MHVCTLLASVWLDGFYSQSLSTLSQRLSIPTSKFGAPQLGPETQSGAFLKNANNVNYISAIYAGHISK
jgi:hypothetical protein